MAARDGRRRSRSGRVLDAALWGVAAGAAGGAALGAAVDGVGAVLGAVIGAAVYAPAEVLTTLNRSAARPKPLLQRILGSVLLMAVFGGLLGLLLGSGHTIVTAAMSGGFLGLLGLRPAKVALGLVLGTAVGAILHGLDTSMEPALVAGVSPSSTAWSRRPSTATGHSSPSWRRRSPRPGFAMSCRSRRAR